MSTSIQSRRLPATLALIALALAGLALAFATSGAAAAGAGKSAQSANHRSSERLVVRGEDTVKDSPDCPGGVCQLELTDGAFRGTPVGTGAYNGNVELHVDATTIFRIRRKPPTMAAWSIGSARKLKRIAGCALGSAERMWIEPRLSGRSW